MAGKGCAGLRREATARIFIRPPLPRSFIPAGFLHSLESRNPVEKGRGTRTFAQVAGQVTGQVAGQVAGQVSNQAGTKPSSRPTKRAIGHDLAARVSRIAATPPSA